MTNATDGRLPYDEMMCIEQFAQVLKLVTHMQGDERAERACAEAERRCAELFDPLWTVGDRIEYMTMLGYLAIDLAANVAYTLDRAAIREDTER